MPIRTNRGRAAVYRRLWGWPMRSPGHLAATVLVLAAILTTVGIGVPWLLDGSGDGAGTGAAEASESDRSSHEYALDDEELGGSAATSTSPPTRLSEPLLSPESTEPDPTALHVAAKWAQAWVHHPDGIGDKKWLAGLEPYTTAELLPVMETVRLANIPSSEVTGQPEAMSAHAKSVVAKVPTDGPELRITIVDTDNGWRVAQYEQAG